MNYINVNDYVEFTYIGPGFSFTGSFQYVKSLYDNHDHGTVTGRKINGETEIIIEK